MGISQATLTKKIHLTHDVFELHYSIPNLADFTSGQFITFLLPELGGRAYSILEKREGLIVLIIKRWGKEDGWRWGSMYLCDMEPGVELKCVGPTGHFTLTDGDKNRCFLWTGTGFVPLYNQLIWALDRWDNSDMKLLFWVKTSNDLFYIEELEKLKQAHENFDYTLYLSREDTENTQRWYITDFLIKDNIIKYNEFYICWAPWMIDSSIKELSKLGIQEEVIFFEKYN